MERTLEIISSNKDDSNFSSNVINVSYHIAEICEDDFISTTGDSGLLHSGQMTAVETTSMMSDVGLDISQLYILLRIFRHKLGAKMFEPEVKMKSLGSKMILPQFGKYK